jgi:hypothetical protein
MVASELLNLLSVMEKNSALSPTGIYLVKTLSLQYAITVNRCTLFLIMLEAWKVLLAGRHIDKSLEETHHLVSFQDMWRHRHTTSWYL